MSGLGGRIGKLFRAAGSDGCLRLVEMMRLRKACLPDPPTPFAARDFDGAKRRCLACSNKRLCDERLEAGTSDGYGLFGPNSHYIEHLRADGLRFG